MNQTDDSITKALNYINIILSQEPNFQIIILSGAGVSTNAGIPDYRSGGYKGQELLELFSNTYGKFINHPLYQQFKQDIKDATPTTSHILAKELHSRKLLKRVYTQNVDGLYQRAGLPSDMIVEFHGSIEDDSIVRYGDNIPEKAISLLLDDFNTLDPLILIVMGTSLQVYPFAAIPNLVPKRSIRILVDLNTSRFLPKRNKLSYLEYGGAHSIGSSPVTFSSRSNGIVRRRRVRSEIEWGYGNRTRKKKWKDFLVTSDTDTFSEELIASLK